VESIFEDGDQCTMFVTICPMAGVTVAMSLIVIVMHSITVLRHNVFTKEFRKVPLWLINLVQ
jgi:hypothetical protein